MLEQIAAFLSDLVGSLHQAQNMRAERKRWVEELARSRSFPWPDVEAMPLEHRRQLAQLLQQLGHGLAASKLDPGEAGLGGVPWRSRGVIGRRPSPHAPAYAPPAYTDAGEQSQPESLENFSSWFVPEMLKRRSAISKWFAQIDLSDPTPADQVEPSGSSASAEEVLTFCEDDCHPSVWDQAVRAFGKPKKGGRIRVHKSQLSPEQWKRFQEAYREKKPTPEPDNDRNVSALSVSEGMISPEAYEGLKSRFAPMFEGGPLLVPRDQVSPAEWLSLSIQLQQWKNANPGPVVYEVRGAPGSR